jgi:23S rRNA (cytidine1920-2'-O)/16S rRNA (cytidine1409-2'-O)-methyltransferase
MDDKGMTARHEAARRSAGAPRLDQFLVERGDFATRSRARDAIVRGTVAINGMVVTKPAATVTHGADVTVTDPAQAYVSRAALKLQAGLDGFGFSPKQLTALDIGASTGGFTQLLLERGAAHVVAVDVGHGQLHPDLALDPRVTNLENLNARDLAAADLGGRAIRCVVSDVSFISLKLALPPALSLAEAGAFCVLLVKPQFEAGRDAIGKGGLLRDPATGPRIAENLAAWLAAEPGWRTVGMLPAPIAGGDGNQEYLIGGMKS